MNIIDSNKRITHYRPRSMYDIFRGPDKLSYDYDETYETETLHTIQIPESSLNELVEFYQRVEESMLQTGSMDVFSHYIQKQYDDKRLRESYPAVKKAYDQYMMLYKLAKSGDSK